VEFVNPEGHGFWDGGGGAGDCARTEAAVNTSATARKRSAGNTTDLLLDAIASS